jgi:catechol 2,3-dioxygenase-like lactoylglutathione lyase family enzyme
MIADVLHFAFTVSNIERSIRWYTQILGLELVHRQRMESAYVRTLVGVPDAILEVAMLKIPGLSSKYSSHMLELIQYVRPISRTTELKNTIVGTPHLALMVDDIHERYDRMRQQGVNFYHPPLEITEGTNAGGFACYLRDPDGITLEFLQPSERRLRELGIVSKR